MTIATQQRFRSRFQQGRRVAGFSVDAVDTGAGKRRQPTGLVRSEDDELPFSKRRKLLSQTRDLARNFSVLGWMIRRHLDYVTNFNFQPMTGSKRLNQQLGAFMDRWSEPEQCDVAGINPLWNYIRLAEARRCLDGDILTLKMSDGRLQAIEGDRLLSPHSSAPRSITSRNWFHGVELDRVGKHLAYAVHNRPRGTDFGAVGSSRFEFETVVTARHSILFAHRERFDQVRGITPLTPAINALVDTYEGIDHLLAKLKAHAMLALAIMRGNPTDPATEENDYSEFKLLSRPMVLDMAPGERAEFLESRTPAAETQAFIELMIQLTLKALDIPYSFFRENFSNYSGSRQALVMYNESAKIKRRWVLLLLNAITMWRLQLAVVDGQLPAKVLQPYMWQWIPTGVPWIDPLKEMLANEKALALGLTSKIRLCREAGEDYETILDEHVEGLKLEEARGLKFDAKPASPAPEPPKKKKPAGDDEEADDTETDDEEGETDDDEE